MTDIHKWNDSYVFSQASTRHRIRIFVDFWNLFDSVKAASRGKPEIDYDSLLQRIFFESSDGQKQFERVHVYVSNPSKDPAAETIVRELENMKGIKVERMPTARQMSKCPKCGENIHRSEEKQADVKLVTDMISHAWNGSYDLDVLVSTDSDFIPAVEFLQAMGIRIVVASFKPNCKLAKAAWGHIDLSV